MSGSNNAAGAPHVFLVAGEPSGDALGGRLMAALKRATGGHIRFSGVGGEQMAAEGLVSQFPLDDLAVMGLAEVLPRLPRLLARLRQTRDAIAAQRPNVVVTIDSPSFTLRVARHARAIGIPVVHYVAPQLWAWRPGRARKLARCIDHLLLVLPFEPEFFASLGVPCTYVGHPAVEDGAIAGDGAAFRARHGIPAEDALLALLPGSRRGLAQRMLPIFGAAIGLLATRIPRLRLVVPVVRGTAAMIESALAAWPVPSTPVRTIEDKRDAYAAATAALTTSGTATLELALAGVAMVVAYRASGFTALIARRMIEVRVFALPNLIAGRMVAPELMQENCTPDALAREIERLIDDPMERARQIAGWTEVRGRLAVEGAGPSERAAQVVLNLMGERAGRAA